jgi:putative transposase
MLIESPQGNLSRGMRQLNEVYTKVFNQRYQRVGHLFQGRYKAILIDKDSYLLSLYRYVVLHAVSANLVKRPEEWPWSSYRATIGKSTRQPFLKETLSQGQRSTSRYLLRLLRFSDLIL